MKRIIPLLLLTMCLLHPVGAGAQTQTLGVTSFSLIETDLTANTQGTIEKDSNGERCAVIKVHTPVEGFKFDTHMMQLVKQEEHRDKGETWIWVSPYLGLLTISHERFGKCDYELTTVVEGGRTYELLLDISTYRLFGITTDTPGATVIIDGHKVGEAPIYQYLSIGNHTISAIKDKYEGSMTRSVTAADHNGDGLHIPMHDMSAHYGKVNITTTDNRAAIVFNGSNVGTGRWSTELKEGDYVVETRRDDCDPQITQFKVVAGKTNSVEATAPVPHTGWLKIDTRPRKLNATIDGKPVDITEQQVVNVGRHEVSFQKNGYLPKTKEYTVKRNETVKDTVVLEDAVAKKLSFYFGGGYTVSSLPGVTAMLGAIIQRNDVQVSYTFGLGKSDPVQWYGPNAEWLAANTYKQSGFAMKYGYQFNLTRQLAITPQVGYAYANLGGTVTDGKTVYADGASAQMCTLGMKLQFVPMHRFYVFAAPQYAVTLSKSDNYDLLSSKTDISVDGFSATIGLLFNF